MNTGCPECDNEMPLNGKRCPKHNVEYLEWLAETAKQDYEEAKKQYERIKK